DKDVLGLLGADGINVLVNGISSTLIPLIADAFHRRKYFDELAHLAAENGPAFTDVTIQREGFVLSKNVNTPQIGVDAVGKGDVNDAVDTAEGNGGLGAVAGEGIEPLSSSSSQQNSQSVLHLASRSTRMRMAPGTAKLGLYREYIVARRNCS